MTPKFWTKLALITCAASLTACAPAFIAAGAGAVIVADKKLEEDNGGDGLF